MNVRSLLYTRYHHAYLSSVQHAFSQVRADVQVEYHQARTCTLNGFFYEELSHERLNCPFNAKLNFYLLDVVPKTVYRCYLIDREDRYDGIGLWCVQVVGKNH
jgi:hypothetical protein